MRDTKDGKCGTPGNEECVTYRGRAGPDGFESHPHRQIRISSLAGTIDLWCNQVSYFWYKCCSPGPSPGRSSMSISLSRRHTLKCSQHRPRHVRTSESDELRRGRW